MTHRLGTFVLRRISILFDENEINSLILFLNFSLQVKIDWFCILILCSVMQDSLLVLIVVLVDF